jgi:hypothetical protein
MRKGYLPGLRGVGICFIPFSTYVLLRLCGRGTTGVGAGGVRIVLSEAVETGDVISEPRGV